MVKKTITYIDYEGIERTEDFYFNLSRAELVMMESSRLGGMRSYYNRIVQAKDTVAIMECFKELIHESIGYKSDDGRRFIKSDEYAKEFEQTEAYSELILELLGDEKVALAFFKSIMPASLSEEIDKDPEFRALVDKDSDK